MKHQKTTDRWDLYAFTDGWPFAVYLVDLQSHENPCEQTKLRMGAEELRDLVYCGERLLAMLDDKA